MFDLLHADDESVHHSGFDLKPETLFGRRGPTAVDQIALADHLHPDHALPLAAHLPEEGARRLDFRIHVRAARVPAHLVDLSPVARRGGPQRPEAVAGDADGAHLPPPLGLPEHVHHAAVARRPVRLGDAVDDERIYVIRPQLREETVNVLAGLAGVAAVGLGLDDVTIARHALHRPAEEGVRAVSVGQVEEVYPAVEGVPHQPCELLLP